MSIFTYHLVKTSYFSAIKMLLFPIKSKGIEGLIHVEFMTSMTLGSAIFSPKRMLLREIALFAQWENNEVIDQFLTQNKTGKLITKGWHLRLLFTRQWGKISGFKIAQNNIEIDNPNKTIVAITIARMKMKEIPRFIRWGKPVEKLVRDHPGTILSLASIRLPRTVSTFSIWKTQEDMTDMVHGHSSVPKPKRHIDAMKERDRKDFHFEFTTLRFIPIAEFGEWKGKSNFIPHLKK